MTGCHWRLVNTMYSPGAGTADTITQLTPSYRWHHHTDDTITVTTITLIYIVKALILSADYQATSILSASTAKKKIEKRKDFLNITTRENSNLHITHMLCMEHMKLVPGSGKILCNFQKFTDCNTLVTKIFLIDYPFLSATTYMSIFFFDIELIEVFHVNWEFVSKYIYM